MNEKKNTTSYDGFSIQEKPQPPKSETLQLADDFCEIILNRFNPNQVAEIIGVIRENCIRSMNHQAEKSQIESKEFASKAEHLLMLAKQL